MPLEIVRIPVLSDNYVWLVHGDGETMVVDPGVAEPVLAEADKRGWRIGAIWNTHWHGDHIGGNAEIKAATGCTVYGPAAEAERIPTLDKGLREGDRVRLGGHEAAVIEVPAHTAGHIAYHFAQDQALFCGDTVFAMGCGRLFEGTAEQMFGNFARLMALPGETAVYCAHEYTLSNGRYALSVDGENEALRTRMVEVEAARERGEPTVPSTIALERATNPFAGLPDAAVFAKRRSEKDSFRG